MLLNYPEEYTIQYIKNLFTYTTTCGRGLLRYLWKVIFVVGFMGKSVGEHRGHLSVVAISHITHEFSEKEINIIDEKFNHDTQWHFKCRSGIPWWRHEMETFSASLGPLCGEFTGHRWITLTTSGDVELWCFLLFATEQTVEYIIETSMIWDVIALIVTSL